MLKVKEIYGHNETKYKILKICDDEKKKRHTLHIYAKGSIQMVTFIPSYLGEKIKSNAENYLCCKG